MKQDKIAILIKRVALVIDKYGNQLLAPYELTNTQYKIMKFMYQNPDKAIRQTDIEETFSMTNPTVTGVIQNLEKKNLVQRIPNPDDKRSKLLILTEQAFAIKEDLYDIGESLEKKITRNLTEEEQNQFCLLLKKMLENN